MKCLLRSALIVCATCASGWATAEPIVYEFEGYLAERSVYGSDPGDTSRYERLPAGFAPGTKFKGRLTYDRALRYFDVEANEERARPVTNLWIRTDAGAFVSSVGSPRAHGPSVESMTPDQVRAHTMLFSQANGDVEFQARVLISWDGPDSELSAPSTGTFNMNAIDPECAIEHCYRYESTTGFITRAAKAAPAAWTPISWDFASGASGWAPRPGTTWTVTDGYYRNASNIAASISLANATITGDFTFAASVYLEWSASGNRGGLVYDYRDDQNYRGVLVTTNGANYVGPVEIFEVINGVRRIVATSTRYRQRQTWSPISISRSGNVTKINDVEVTQLPIPGAKVGLLARYNMVRFDDVVVATPRSN
jgi:hypothetical protein